MEGSFQNFWIGHHQDRANRRVSPELVQQAHISGYDMVTSSITSDFFHSRVLALLSSAQPLASQSSHGGEHGNSQHLTVPPLSLVDTLLVPDESTSQLIALTSSWLDLTSPDPMVADVSRQVLLLEVAYAAFCGITYLLIPGPKLHHDGVTRGGLLRYARVVQEVLAIGPYMQVKIWFPIIDDPEEEVTRMGDLSSLARSDESDTLNPDRSFVDLYGTWEAWNSIRTFCKYNARLCVALILPKHLPPVKVQSRWYSEPVRLLTIADTSFAANAKGYPTLPKPHQTFLNRFMRLRTAPWILLCNIGAIPGSEVQSLASPQVSTLPASEFPTPSEAGIRPQNHDPALHLSYLRNLQNKQSQQTPLEKFGSGYQDYLQAPLQPLTVNLESITYEVFEKDPIKYAWYEKAIARALHDWIEQGKPTSGPGGRVVVAVVGAGRGPLVTRALRASEDVDVEIDLWALEKNPNAFVLLQHHNADPDLWAERVHLVKSDMRTWRGPWREVSAASDVGIGQALSPDTVTSSFSTDARPRNDGSTSIDHYRVDILISELLGSFADNELSPECLDGVQHVMNPVHGISIPASYTAHLTPIAAPKLHADICVQSLTNPHAPEIPYVVMLNAIDYLSTGKTGRSGAPNDSTQSLRPIIHTAWSFSHPNRQLPPHTPASQSPHSAAPLTNAHNARHVALTFPIPHRGVCHGIAGFFETILYPGVELSTNPLSMDAKSEGMISWFPIYYPLKTPIYAPDNSEITINMWRQTDDRKVWYEWIVEVFVPSPSPSPTTHHHQNPTDEPTSPNTQNPSSPAAKAKGKARLSSTAAGGPPQPGADANRLREDGQSQPLGPGSRVGGSGRMRMRIAASELHSSVKEACLM